MREIIAREWLIVLAFLLLAFVGRTIILPYQWITAPQIVELESTKVKDIFDKVRGPSEYPFYMYELITPNRAVDYESMSDEQLNALLAQTNPKASQAESGPWEDYASIKTGPQIASKGTSGGRIISEADLDPIPKFYEYSKRPFTGFIADAFSDNLGGFSGLGTFFVLYSLYLFSRSIVWAICNVKRKAAA